MNAQTFLREDYLKTAFRMFDVDNSGKIDASELQTLLQGEEIKDIYSKEQLNAAINEVDKNGDGEIDFEEFMHMMRGIE
jgi:Ca2+-binding EF-hand superfamily protein